MPLNIHPERTVELTSYDKDERSRLRSIVGWILAASLIGGSLLYAVKANAEEIPLYVSEKQGVVVRLMPGPCVDAISISMINPLHVGRFKAIQSFWPQRDGTVKSHAGCWTELSKEEARTEEEVFLLVFDDRETGGVAKSEFNKPKGGSGA